MHPKVQKKPHVRLQDDALRELQSEIDAKLSPDAQIEVGRIINDSYLKDKGAKKATGMTPSHIFLGDVVKLYLHWFVHYHPYSFYVRFKLSTGHQVVKSVMKKSHLFL
jgi:hypothetical protein